MINFIYECYLISIKLINKCLSTWLAIYILFKRFNALYLTRHSALLIFREAMTSNNQHHTGNQKQNDENDGEYDKYTGHQLWIFQTANLVYSRCATSLFAHAEYISIFSPTCSGMHFLNETVTSRSSHLFIVTYSAL